MIRTRDFVVFLVIVAILFGAIFLTINRDIGSSANQAAALLTAESVETVVIEDEADLSHQDRLLAMRESVQQYRSTYSEDDRFIVREGEPEEIYVAMSEAEPVEGGSTQSVQLCTNYAPYQGWWPRGVVVEMREGVRLVFEETVSDVDGELVTTENILVRLPAAAQPSSNPSCLQSDVVGVANDGSLIRNNEQSLYGIFSAETVVGYALDGFPIYGQNNSVIVDSCGGAFGSSGYGYMLQTERESVINCFSGIPASL